jgi:hypothetical protein
MTTKAKPSALQAMRKDLSETLKQQIRCVDDYGIVFSGRRCEYQELTRKAADLRKQIDWWERNINKGE